MLSVKTMKPAYIQGGHDDRCLQGPLRGILPLGKKY